MGRGYPIIAGIDLGSQKVAVLLCEMTPGGLEVTGFGQAESHGVRKGVVVNIDSTVLALTRALDEAKGLAKNEIHHVVVGVTGAHIQTMSSTGMVPIRDQEVHAPDIQRVIEAASAVNIPLDREVVQMVPQEFRVDGQDGIHQPLGMYGKRLEVQLQMITASITPMENLRRCLQKVGLKVNHFISNPLASGRAVVTPEAKEAGVCVVDIGAASTDIAVFQEGALRWIRSLPIGGMHLTNDLAVGLKTSLQDAEKIKFQYGCVYHPDLEEMIEIPGLSGQDPRVLERRMIATILQPRLDEILVLIRNELAKEGVDEALPSGIILTGGVSHLKGILQAAERVFRLPVRIGRPSGLGGLSDMVSSPSYSTLVGLLQLAYEENEELQYYTQLYEKKGMRRAQLKFSRWFKDFF
jgi:cell division protein FtsA